MELYSEALDGRSGREAGRQLLKRLCGDRKILLTDRGKPFFADGGPCFSISHSKSRVFCALADQPVGVDAEEADRDIDLRLAQKILSPAELAQYEAAVDKREALLRFWVLKEALVKATGQGLRGYPKDTDFKLDDPRLQLLEGHLVAVIELRRVYAF